MPLQIVRNDITKVQADAIVNATNPSLLAGGRGVDAAIHNAAGPELAAALEKIGSCPECGVVSTDAFLITCCRRILHVATPVFDEADGSGQDKLEQCYRNVLREADRQQLKSIAVPVLSAGNNGFPAAEAYTVATGAIRGYLAATGSELEILLVVFSREILGVSDWLHDEVSRFIDDNYVDESHRMLDAAPCMCAMEEAAFSEAPKAEMLPRRPAKAPLLNKRRRAKPEQNFQDETISAHNMIIGGSDELSEKVSMNYGQPAAKEPASENYAAQDLSFGDMCDWWMHRKNISISEFYCDANITRAVFYNIRQNPGSAPKKTTALAIVIGLKLNKEEAKDLLMRAGLALSPYHKTDLVVQYFIENKIYDIDRINLELYENDLALLGSAAK